MSLRIALLSPIAWRTPPRRYGPWELVVSLLAEGLVARGVDVTLFATGDSRTAGRLRSVCPTGYEEDPAIEAKVWESLHIAQVFEAAAEFDLIHNHFDFLPLAWSGLVETPVLTTIHGFSSARILPVYRRYNGRTHYVSISDSDRSPELDYEATVHHGIDLGQFTFREEPGEYLAFMGRFHPDKGAHEAIEIARRAGRRLRMAGIVQDRAYFEERVLPWVDGERVTFEGSVGPEERDRLLGGAAALLHPIAFAEPFGLAVVEAMATGTPVVAYPLGSMPEIVKPGENGYLVRDAAEAAEAVAALPAISRRRCRAIVEERFTVDRMVESYLRVYERIMSARRRSSRAPRSTVATLEAESDIA